MSRYIALSIQACAVFFDEVAGDPLNAIVAGAAKISSDRIRLDLCRRDDVDALYDVYRAPENFQEVGASDYRIVTEQCIYVGSFKSIAKEVA